MLFNFIKNVTSTVNEFITLLNKQGKATLVYENRSTYIAYITVLRDNNEYVITHSYENVDDMLHCTELTVLNELLQFIQNEGFDENQYSVEIL